MSTFEQDHANVSNTLATHIAVTDEMVDRARKWELTQLPRDRAGHLAEWWREALTAALGGTDG